MNIIPFVSISIVASFSSPFTITCVLIGTLSPSVSVRSPCCNATPIAFGLPARIDDILSISSTQIVARSIASFSSEAVGGWPITERALCSTAVSRRSGRNSIRSESTKRLALMMAIDRNGAYSGSSL